MSEHLASQNAAEKLTKQGRKMNSNFLRQVRTLFMKGERMRRSFEVEAYFIIRQRGRIYIYTSDDSATKLDQCYNRWPPTVDEIVSISVINKIASI
jgi:hypothetical protein